MKILVINNYGQFCHLIHRALRDLDQDSQIVSNTTPVEEILEKKVDGMVLSGGPSIDRIGICERYIDAIDIPILGICLGHQLMARKFGATIRSGKAGGYAEVEIEVLNHDDIFKGLDDREIVWASHADEVATLPDGFICLARSEISEIEAMKHITRPLYGLQFHPEVSHTRSGNEILTNFIEICKNYNKS